MQTGGRSQIKHSSAPHVLTCWYVQSCRRVRLRWPRSSLSRGQRTKGTNRENISAFFCPRAGGQFEPRSHQHSRGPGGLSVVQHPRGSGFRRAPGCAWRLGRGGFLRTLLASFRGGCRVAAVLFGPLGMDGLRLVIGRVMSRGPGPVTTTATGCMTRSTPGSGFRASSGRPHGFRGALVVATSAGRRYRHPA